MRLKRFAKYLNHLTLPEIIDFNALNDAQCLRFFAKRCSSSCFGDAGDQLQALIPELSEEFLRDVALKAFAKYLNHLTLPEIIDFNALNDAQCLRFFAKRCIGQQFPFQPGNHIGERCAVVGIAWRDPDRHQFAPMIHHHMQFEAEEPTHGRMPACRQPFKGAVAADARIGADWRRQPAWCCRRCKCRFARPKGCGSARRTAQTSAA